MADTQTSTRSEILDVVRGIAIALVVACHYFPVATAGKTGVDLFFVLSGYLIGGMLLDARGAAGYFSSFYRRRAFRILPLYWLLLVLFPAPGQPAWWYLTFTQSFGWVSLGAFPGDDVAGVTWSLAIEEQFYLILPAMIAFLPQRWLVRALWICVIAAPLWRYGLRDATPVAWLLLPCRLDSLMSGVLIACFCRGMAQHTWLWFVLALVSPLLDYVTTMQGAWVAFPHYSVIAFGWSAYLLFMLRLPTQRLVLLKPVALLGIGAYSIYLFHAPIYLLTGRRWWLAVPVMAAIAAVSWRYLEAPLMQVARRPLWPMTRRSSPLPAGK